MLVYIATLAAFVQWLPQMNPPGQIATIGSTAFRHPYSSAPFMGLCVLGTSSDGKRVYTGNFWGCSSSRFFNTVFVWNAETGKLLNSYSPEKMVGRIVKYRFSPDGLRVVAYHKENQLFEKGCRFCLLDPDTGRVIREGKTWEPPPARRRGYSNELSFALPMPADNTVVHYTEKWVWLLNPETGKKLEFTPPVPVENDTLVEVSADGRAVLAGPVEGKYRLYELPEMKVKAEWAETKHRVFEGFTPESKHLIVWELKKAGWALELWSVVGLARQTLLEDIQRPDELVFSPNGKVFARRHIGSENRVENWEVYSASTGKQLSTLWCNSFGTYPCFDYEGQTVWMIRGERLVIPYDATTGKPKVAGSDLPGPVKRFRFLGDEKLVGFCDEAIVTWEAKTGGKLSQTSIAHARDRNFGVAFSPSGDRLVYTDKEGAIICWDHGTKTEIKTTIKREDRNLDDLDEQFTTDGRLHLARDGKNLTIRNPLEGKILIERPVPDEWHAPFWENQLSVLASSRDGKRLAATRINYPEPSPVVLINLTDAKAKATILHPKHPVNTLTISPDNRYLVATGDRPSGEGAAMENVFTVWDLSAPEEMQTRVLSASEVVSTQFSPNGKTLAIHCDSEVLFMETVTWTMKAKVKTTWWNYSASLPNEAYGDTLAWSPSGRLLAMQLGDERIAVWDVAKMLEKR